MVITMCCHVLLLMMMACRRVAPMRGVRAGAIAEGGGAHPALRNAEYLSSPARCVQCGARCAAPRPPRGCVGVWWAS
jgi:hypothetical protein